MLEILFWIMISAILYVYLGYPLLLMVLNIFRSSRPILNPSGSLPEVSLLISAYNEEQCIRKKIVNSLEIDYPRDLIEIAVVSNSSDQTNAIVREYADKGIRLIVPPHKGKFTAQNYALPKLNGEIVIVTDADTFCAPDAVKTLVKHFADNKVGCVVAKVDWTNPGDNVITQGGSLYYSYELFIRKKESDLGMLGLGSTGLMGFPKRLFTPTPPFLAEDTFLPLLFLKNGYRVIYEPDSVAVTKATSNSEGEFRVRKRNANIDASAMFYMRSLLNPFKYPLPFLMLASHKIGRWLVPFLMIGVFFLNFFLLGKHLYEGLMILQISFYSLTLISFLLSLFGVRIKYLFIPYYFCLINIAASAGCIKAVFGNKQTSWEPVRANDRKGKNLDSCVSI